MPARVWDASGTLWISARPPAWILVSLVSMTGLVVGLYLPFVEQGVHGTLLRVAHELMVANGFFASVPREVARNAKLDVALFSASMIVSVACIFGTLAFRWTRFSVRAGRLEVLGERTLGHGSFGTNAFRLKRGKTWLIETDHDVLMTSVRADSDEGHALSVRFADMGHGELSPSPVIDPSIAIRLTHAPDIGRLLALLVGGIGALLAGALGDASHAFACVFGLSPLLWFWFVDWCVGSWTRRRWLRERWQASPGELTRIGPLGGRRTWRVEGLRCTRDSSWRRSSVVVMTPGGEVRVLAHRSRLRVEGIARWIAGHAHVPLTIDTQLQ